MMFFLPTLSELGSVKLKKIYHQYDIPRTFLAEAKRVGSLIAIWVDQDESYDSWYYVPVNDDEIVRVEDGLIQLRDIFCHKFIYEVKTGHDERTQSLVNILEPKDVDGEALPPAGYALKKVGDELFKIEQRPIESFLFSNSSHEIRISKRRSKKPIEWEPIEYIFGAWRKLHNSILRTAQGISDDITILPGAANTGSYKMQFHSSHNDDVYLGVAKLFDAVKSANGSIEHLKGLKVDLSILELLLSNLVEYNLQFEVRTNSGAVVNSLDFNLIENTINAINEYNQQKISSDLVPQANEITRIITFIKNKAAGMPFTAESEGIEPRQINYYKSAAEMLGFSSNGALTPIGWRLSGLEEDKEIYNILMERFETSRCGWAWLTHSKVSSALDLDPESAELFLREWSTGLSESTLVRRASTLRKWPIVFKEKLSSRKQS